MTCRHFNSEPDNGKCSSCQRGIETMPAAMQLDEKRPRLFCAECDEGGQLAISERCKDLTILVPEQTLSGSGRSFIRGRNVILERGGLYLVLPFEGEVFEDTLVSWQRSGALPDSHIAQLVFESGRMQAVDAIADMHSLHAHTRLGGYGDDDYHLSRVVATNDINRIVKANGGSNVAVNLATGKRVCDTPQARVASQATGSCDTCKAADAQTTFVRPGAVQKLCTDCTRAHWHGAFATGRELRGDSYDREVTVLFHS